MSDDTDVATHQLSYHIRAPSGSLNQDGEYRDENVFRGPYSFDITTATFRRFFMRSFGFGRQRTDDSHRAKAGTGCNSHKVAVEQRGLRECSGIYGLSGY